MAVRFLLIQTVKHETGYLAEIFKQKMNYPTKGSWNSFEKKGNYHGND